MTDATELDEAMIDALREAASGEWTAAVELPAATLRLLLAALTSARKEVERLTEHLAQPCGTCHPCEHWAAETWRRAGGKLPHKVDVDEAMERLRLVKAALFQGGQTAAIRAREAVAVLDAGPWEFWAEYRTDGDRRAEKAEAEVERLHIVVDREARARQAAEQERDEAEARAQNAEHDYDARGERLWRLATLAGHEHWEAENDACAELTVTQALAQGKAAEGAVERVRALIPNETTPEHEEDGWAGLRARNDHRSVGVRAWVSEVQEWCYPTMPCALCEPHIAPFQIRAAIDGFDAERAPVTTATTSTTNGSQTAALDPTDTPTDGSEHV